MTFLAGSIFLAAFPVVGAPDGGGVLQDILVGTSVVREVIFNAGDRRLGTRDRWGILRSNTWFGLALGDVNGDGRLDHVHEMGIFLGHGDGHFGILTTAFDPPCVSAAAAGDLNHDGYDDVVLASDELRVFFGRPDGTLSAAPGPNLPGWGSWGLDLVDLDGDEELDLLGRGSDGPILAFNEGGGVFQRSEEGVAYVWNAVVRDLDGDGLKDVVSLVDLDGSAADGRGSQATVLLHFGAVPRKFAPRVAIPLGGLATTDGGYSNGLAVGDLDRDGNEDILAAVSLPEVAFFLLRGSGDGSFTPPVRFPAPDSGRVSALLLHDLDLDGCLDLVVGWASQLSEVYWGAENGFFGPSNPTVLPIRAPRSLAAFSRASLHRFFVRGDANGDGDTDVADVLAILDQIFRGGAVKCGDASDADDSGWVNVLDPIYVLRHLFAGGSPPPYPFPLPGGDPTDDHGSWREGGVIGDLGCSAETFRSAQFQPCSPDSPQEGCEHPILQLLDLCPREGG